ncbi:PREDICTED: uncharacterized protein K02A2.6-like [Priapulus caudatus]|uniref:Uncharacterized protein K02A2.6-like n=1 Tax=Priapulus caudatus TaxID=37621 RepID=A0ABM1DYU7_PRICU|nr:PREDICTED: uncharacterized protein K02A2.6-like [Priapulus caudatus]
MRVLEQYKLGYIENLERKCSICQQAQRTQSHEPLLQHGLPTRPWQFLGTDLFYLAGDEYLIISDYYSKFSFVKKIGGRATSQTIVNITKSIFAEQGVPETIISDNGPQFDGQAYKVFAEKWGFDHVTASPHYPQSNGLIERQVQTVKRVLTKARAAGIDVDMAMLVLRSTPIDHHLPSPAELLNARRMKANLPTRIYNNAPNKDVTMQRLLQWQASQKAYYDEKAGGSLALLIKGQPIRIQDQTSGQWRPGIVTGIRPEQRSYEDAGTNCHQVGDDNSASSEAVANTYRTRSGRAVIPRKVFDM